MPKRTLSLVGLCAVALLAACTVKDPNNPKFIVAEAKGIKITKAELTEKQKSYLSRYNVTPDQVPAEQLASLTKRILEQEIQQRLLVAAAKDEGLKPDPEKVDAQFKQLKARAGTEESYQEQLKKSGMTEAKLKEDIGNYTLLEQLLKKKVPAVADPKMEEVEAFYKSNEDKFKQPESVRASHILVKVDPKADKVVKDQKRKIIDAARARVVKGEDFAKVAQEVSEDPGSGQQGGDLNFFRHGEMVPEFDKIAFGSKVGTLSPVFETQFGLHFMKVTDHKDARVVSLDEARPSILSHLKNQQQEKSVQDYLASLTTAAKVVYHLPVPTPPPAAAVAPIPAPAK
jgi:peptidyl-prolyl cis-trans isomerase C